MPKYLSAYSLTTYYICKVPIVFVEALVSTEVSSIFEGGGATALVALSLRFQQPTTAGSHSVGHHVNRGIYNSWHLAVTVSRQCRQPQATLKQLKLMLMPKQSCRQQTALVVDCLHQQLQLLHLLSTQTHKQAHSLTNTHTKGLNMQRFLYAT